MENEDTPETNAAQFGTGTVGVEFARRLERQRDAAQRIRGRLRVGLVAAENFLRHATGYIGVINDHDMPKALVALDRVRAALAETDSDQTYVEYLERIVAEIDPAQYRSGSAERDTILTLHRKHFPENY